MATNKKNRGSEEGGRQPYLRIKTWLNDPFWLRTYKDRPEIIQRYNEWLQGEIAGKKNIATLEQNLK